MDERAQLDRAIRRAIRSGWIEPVGVSSSGKALYALTEKGGVALRLRQRGHSEEGIDHILRDWPRWAEG